MRFCPLNLQGGESKEEQTVATILNSRMIRHIVTQVCREDSMDRVSQLEDTEASVPADCGVSQELQ